MQKSEFSDIVSQIMNKIELIKTCISCPEQYDAKYRGNIIGYLRLRWGYFAVYYPSVEGDLIYDAEIGDSFTGLFQSHHQRQLHLDEAKMAIAKQIVYEETQ